MNVTLSADSRLVEKTRRYASRKGVSLNRLIRQYMQNIVGDDDCESCVEEFARLARQRGGASPEGFTFNREESHERPD